MFIQRLQTLSLAVACLALILLAAACGSGRSASGGQASTTPAATPTSASLAPTTTGSPSAAPVAAPTHFKAASITFVSGDEAFCLGTARGHGTLLLSTHDRGASWTELAVLPGPLGRPGSGASSAVWGTRFASALQGFVFGDRLWETPDGGLHWAPAPAPAGQILSLAPIDGQLLGLVAKSSGSAVLVRRPLAGGPWYNVATVKSVGLLDPTDLISTQSGTAAVLDGSSVLVATNGGLSITSRPTPSVAGFTPGLVAVTSAHSLALLLVGQGAAGSSGKLVYTSSDAGAHWTKAGAPSNEGDPVTLAGGSPTNLIFGAASGASWLERSANGGHSWTTGLTYGDGGLGWADLGFTNASAAVVVHGPADSVGNSDGRPGQLLLSSNGGATWNSVTF